MKKQAILLLTILTVAGAGCNLPDSPRETFMKQARQDFAEWTAHMALWRQDWDENEQKLKNNLTQLDLILGQEKVLLETLGNDEQIQPADFQLYKDFLLFIQKSDDQIKIYEFIEKMRANLPADKMETIEKLHHQLKQNLSEYNSLHKQQDVLKERLMQLQKIQMF